MVALPAQSVITATAQSLAQAPVPQVDVDRKEQIRQAWKAYRGQLPDPLKVKRDQPNDNVKSNRCAPIVDKGCAFLFGQPLKIEVAQNEDAQASDEPPDAGKKKASPQQQYLDGFWGSDDMKMTRLTKIEMNGGVCGQVFVKLIPPTGSMKYPRMVNLDPQLVRIVTDPEDCDSHLAYIIEYPKSADWQKRQIIARVDPNNDLEVTGEYDVEDTWTITNYVRRTSAAFAQDNRWIQVGLPEEWPYPFAPIVTTQNLPNPNEPWGIPDLTPDLIAHNKAINFILSCIARILKYHGHPKTWGKGFRANQMQVAIDDVFIIESEKGELHTIEMTSELQGFLAYLSTLRADMDEQSRVPAVALGREETLPKGNLSGVALALLFQPLLEKTTLKQRLYGQLICDLSRAALVLGGKLPVEAYADCDIKLHWQNLLPVDDLQAAQTALIYEQLGVSIHTLLQKLGFDPEDEANKKAQEDQQKLANFNQGQGMAPPLQPGVSPTQQPAGMPPISANNPMQAQGGQVA